MLHPVQCCPFLRVLFRGLIFICFTIPMSPLGAQSQPSGVATSPGPDNSAVVKLDSVSQTALAPHLNQTIRVIGTIGNYLGNRTRYRFALADGSAVVVIGEYPQMGGTHWAVTARVVMDGNSYALAEVSKGALTARVKVDPRLLLATVPLI